MNTASLLSELRQRGVTLRVAGGRLHCKAPNGVLTADLRLRLQEHKQELLDFLVSVEALAQQEKAIVPLQAHGSRIPVFGVGGHNGDVFCYRELARQLGAEQPFFGLQPPGLDGLERPHTRVEDLAEYFAARVRAFHPQGPCIIVGYCAGGTVALELARQLQRDGSEIEFVGLFGSPYPFWFRRGPRLRRYLRQQVERVMKHSRALYSAPAAEWLAYFREKMRTRNARQQKKNVIDPQMALRAEVEAATLLAVQCYTPGRFEGRLCVFSPSPEWARSVDVERQWHAHSARSEHYWGPAGCDAVSMLREPHAAAFASLLRLAQARDTGDAVVAAASLAPHEMPGVGGFQSV